MAFCLQGVTSLFHPSSWQKFSRCFVTPIRAGQEGVLSHLPFSTRSDAASWLISVGIQAQQELFERVYETVAEIRRLRGQAQDIARQVMERQAPRVYKEDGPQQAEQGS